MLHARIFMLCNLWACQEFVSVLFWASDHWVLLFVGNRVRQIGSFALGLLVDLWVAYGFWWESILWFYRFIIPSSGVRIFYHLKISKIKFFWSHPYIFVIFFFPLCFMFLQVDSWDGSKGSQLHIFLLIIIYILEVQFIHG